MQALLAAGAEVDAKDEVRGGAVGKGGWAVMRARGAWLVGGWRGRLWRGEGRR